MLHSEGPALHLNWWFQRRMTMTKIIIGTIVVAFAVVLALGANADAQLPKQGSYSGVFGWYFPPAQVVQVEKGHFVWGGTSLGAFRNDDGSGFLHGAGVVCAAAGEFKNGAQTHNGGDCVATDGDGDKAVLTWKCTGCPSSRSGVAEWTGGTGKYKGLSGRSTYQETVNQLGSGWSVWKGEWKLPE
jgi:hypothetical protein